MRIPMNSDSPSVLIVLTGPTAVGKTSLSISIARTFSAEILSADSRQFFREIRIGTAQPSIELLQSVPHHFIAHLSIHDQYNVSLFESDVLLKLDHLYKTSSSALLVGGSGLYINAVCHGIDELPDPDGALREQLINLYQSKGIKSLQDKLRVLDPVYFKQVDQSNPKRLLRAIEVCLATGLPYSSLRKNEPKPRKFRILKIGLHRDRDELNEHINARVDQMMEDGFLTEVKGLMPFRHLNALNTVGYKELFDHLDGKYSLEQAVEKIKTNTRRFAKRQMTWFRKDQEISWFHPDDLIEIIRFIKQNSRTDELTS
jgi:tRNA dimethylallyltransferase